MLGSCHDDDNASRRAPSYITYTSYGVGAEIGCGRTELSLIYVCCGNAGKREPNIKDLEGLV